jgi:hypothetical protein
MSKQAENAQTRKKRPLAQPLLELLNGQALSRPRFLEQLPFLLYLCGLALIYIGYGYFTESTVKQIYRADIELKELKAEYLTSQSELQQIRQQSRIADAIKDIGLKESVSPPRKIIIPETSHQAAK